MNWKGAVTWCITLLQKACISNGLRVWAVNAVSCCKSCKGYGKGYEKSGANAPLLQMARGIAPYGSRELLM